MEIAYSNYNPYRNEESGIPFLASDAKKRANDMAIAKEYMDYFDLTHDIDKDNIERIQENFELHAGRWTTLNNVSNAASIMLGQENIVIGSGELNHFPIIDRVSKSIVSDLIARPLTPIIKDNSSKARNERDRNRIGKIKEYFQQNFIQPTIERISMEYDVSNGIVDLANTPIEFQQQRQSDIMRRVEETTPDEILAYLERFQTYDELIASALLNEGLRHVKGKHQFDIGAEYAVVTGEEYYRMDILNKKPHFEALNTKWVTWGGSEHTEFAEDGQFAKYVQYLTPEDALTKYAHHLARADVKKIANMYSKIPGYTGNGNKMVERDIEMRVVDAFANNPELQSEINVRTREGQEKLRQVYSNIAYYGRSGYGIKETYITWRWMRRVKFVTRLINNKEEVFIRDEHYVSNPAMGDVKVEDKVIPQTWSGIKLGDETYLNVKPIPYQYNNINDPFDVKLGIYGGRYNTFQNNVRNNAPIDLGKPWQYKYNVLMKRMEEHQATDIGKVFLGTTTMIPKGWTWAQWYKSLFVAKTAIVSNHREGINNMDSSLFRSIDLSRAADIESDIRQLEYYENKIITSMYYSAQKIGSISQYATNENTQKSIEGVDRQMYRFVNKNREIKENVLNSFLRLCLHAYKNDEDVKSVVLDDFLKAHYELNFGGPDDSNFILTVVDDFKEAEKLSSLKQLSLSFLQNGMKGKDLFTIVNSDSMAEIKQMLDDMEIREEKRSKEEYERQMALEEQRRQANESMLQQQQQFEAMQAEREFNVKIKLAEINSNQMANANDINNNKLNDYVESTILNTESNEYIEKMKIEHDANMKKEELDLERERMKNDIDKEKIKISNKQ